MKPERDWRRGGGEGGQCLGGDQRPAARRCRETPPTLEKEPGRERKKEHWLEFLTLSTKPIVKVATYWNIADSKLFTVIISAHTDKIENKNFPHIKGNSEWSGAKSYMRRGFLIYEEMRKYFTIYEEAISHIWLCLFPSEFPFIWEEFIISAVKHLHKLPCRYRRRILRAMHLLESPLS